MTFLSKPLPAKKITVKIRNNEYEISYPNVGQLLDIDVLRDRLTNGRYDIFKYSLHPSFVHSAKRADVVAYFNTLIPQLRKDITAGMKEQNMLQLSVQEFQELEKAFDEYIQPWLDQWEAILSTPIATVDDSTAEFK